tara:strand:+ start:159 stop:437 length:279 start_codon:yes stop_codon:yes gene_type:complete
MMPTGYKMENGYSTTKDLGGKSYQEIADCMTDAGFKMNHSTARNVLVNGLMKIAKPLCQLQEKKMTDDELKKLAKNPDFQQSVAYYLSEIKR